jgi:hypothetical protein
VNLWLMALIVAAAAGLAVGLMYLVRRRSRVDHFFVEVERGSGIFTFLGTAFAVLLAFVVLEAFGSFNDAKTGAEEEAISVVQLSRTAAFFIPAERDPLEGTLICYGHAVIHDEWPAMKHGGRSPVVQGWVNRLEDGLRDVHPADPAQEAVPQLPSRRTKAPRPPRATQRSQLPAGAGLVHPRPRGDRDGRVRAVPRRPTRALRRAGKPDRRNRGACRVGPAARVVPRPSVRELQREASSRTRWSAAGDVESEQVGAPQLCDSEGHPL